MLLGGSTRGHRPCGLMAGRAAIERALRRLASFLRPTSCIVGHIAPLALAKLIRNALEAKRAFVGHLYLPLPLPAHEQPIFSPLITLTATTRWAPVHSFRPSSTSFTPSLARDP